MGWIKRIGLFLAVNLLVVTTISILLQIFHVQPFLTRQGLDVGSLLAFCLIWGMGGAFISLALSKVMAKWMMGVQVIDPNTNDPTLRDLVQTVYSLSRQAGLAAMPEVGIYSSPEVNAFATGPTKSKALVAISTGLLQRMRKEGIEGVLGHEISHIANGDMVTMTLIQGVVNAFVMFFARLIAFVLVRGMSRSKDDDSINPLAYNAVVLVLQIVFMILGSLVVAWFSRYREFRADAGGARLAGREKMVAALQSLQRFYEARDPSHEQEALQTLKISSHSGLFRLFATHPPLEERIARLQQG